MVPADVLTRIRDALPLSEVVQSRVRLKRAGREWRGLSPFNQERTPSFFVNDQKQFYHCFSSGKHGDIFTFLMEVHGLTFPEAVEELAGRAGIEIPRQQATAIERERQQVRTDAIGVLESAQAFFALCGRGAPAVQTFASKRGLSTQTIASVGIGFAPADRFAVRHHLEEKGFTVESMVRAGLLVSGPTVAVPFSYYRNRVTFPVRDRRGKVISFGARAIEGDQQPKYLNGPETELFDKGCNLYGLDRARESISKTGWAVVVEGYMDVEQAHQAGIRNVVACMGTALTLEQLHALWTVAPMVVMALDGDKAGDRAAARMIETALPAFSPDRRLSFATMPAGQDPDDVIRNAGPGEFQAIVSSAEMASDRIWRMVRDETPGTTPEDRRKIETRVQELCSLIPDIGMQRAYRDELNGRARSLASGSRRVNVAHTDRSAGAAVPPREASLVYAALLHPEYGELDDFHSTHFHSPLASRLQGSILNAVANQSASVGVGDFPRDAAVLFQSIPQPAPSYLAKVDVEGFAQAVRLHRVQAARVRLR